MAITSGTRLGPYEILAPIGAGGMGEVYKATDTRLERTVAIKVLPEHLAESPERKARFEREAKAISQLNHPHICTLYDVGEQDGIDFIVMEYIEGETLAERLKKGPLPLDKALEYGIQIADGLDKAHRAEIVHRDLKPANAMLTKLGIKLLDFGLAKVLGVETGPETSDAPTRQKDLTREHAIIGTLQYMAPEQLEGKTADARTDIFAFGAVLYKMLTGNKAFEGESQASLIGAIMNAEPAAPSTLYPTRPKALDHVVHTCLAKDPDERWGTAGDVGRQLSWIRESHEERAAIEVTSPRRSRKRVLWAGALLVAGLTAGLALFRTNLPRSQEPVTRLVVDLPPEHRLVEGFHPIAFAPDGAALVYAATAAGAADSQLFLHRLDRFEAEAIPDTVGAQDPFFSPDGQWVGFFMGSALRWISLATGAVATVHEGVEFFRGASWAIDDSIVFSDLTKGLLRVPATGGEPESLAARDDRGLHRFPHVLPDGKAVLFTVGLGEAARLALLSLDTGDWHTLGEEGIGAKYVTAGHIAYGREKTLQLVPFDRQRLLLGGDPQPVVRDVYTPMVLNIPYFTTSRGGSLAYVSGRAQSQLMWVDRAGKAEPFDELLAGGAIPRLSPDGKRLAIVFGARRGGGELWVLDPERGTRRLLLPDGNSIFPLWTPDGARLAFVTDKSGKWEPVWKNSDGSGSEEKLAVPPESVGLVFASAWHPDGRSLILENGRKSWLLPLDGEPRPMWTESGRQWGAAFSPDGNWVAFVSDESGRGDVYVRPYPEGGRTVVISNEGGTEPVWSRDGRELFYRNGEHMMVVPVSLGATLQPGAPRVLFTGNYLFPPISVPNYDVSLDGQRFLMVQRDPSSIPRRIHVVRNWFEELERLVPTDN